MLDCVDNRSRAGEKSKNEEGRQIAGESVELPYQDLNVYTFLTQEEMCQKCVDISVIKSYEK